MPRYAGYTRTFQKGTNLTQGGQRNIDNYKSLQTAQRRHDYTAGAPDVGTPLTLTGGTGLGITLARFRRSFGGGADDPPTATAGNNYQSPDVFNGSTIRDLKAMIRVTNKSNADPITLTVYRIAVSFYDGYIQDQLWNITNAPLQFLTTATNEGEMDWRGTFPALALEENSMFNSKFKQHFYQKVGEITMSQEGSGKETTEININGLPPKCKRSQSGMFFGYVLYNDTTKNEGRTVAMDYAFQNHFIEVPSENRLPWLS